MPADRRVGADGTEGRVGSARQPASGCGSIPVHRMRPDPYVEAQRRMDRQRVPGAARLPACRCRAAQATGMTAETVTRCGLATFRANEPNPFKINLFGPGCAARQERAVAAWPGAGFLTAAPPSCRPLSCGGEFRKESAEAVISVVLRLWRDACASNEGFFRMPTRVDHCAIARTAGPAAALACTRSIGGLLLLTSP